MNITEGKSTKLLLTYGTVGLVSQYKLSLI